MNAINARIAKELDVQLAQVTAAVDLLGEGATVPFIARYRKEKTGGLDDTQLRKLEERLGYLTELEQRRATVLKSITEQDKLTPELERSIRAAESKVELEDLYAPFKPKRRTKAQIAREAGLEPLADMLINDPTRDPSQEATKFINAEQGVVDAKGALDGARAILIERIAEDAALVGDLRQWLWSNGVLTSKVIKGKQDEGAKFSDYFDFSQPVRDVPSHRALALLRGQNEGFLSLNLDVSVEGRQPHPADMKIRAAANIADRNRPADSWLVETARLTWKKLHGSLSTDLMVRLKEDADTAAIGVFKSNLKDLLLAAPAGARVTMGLDPGIRTGVKVAVVDHTGKLLDTATIYPHEPRNDWAGSLAVLAALCAKHKVNLIAIGNGTASRETDKLVGDLMKKHAELKLAKIMVSEAGASVYSASELASQEFPNLDVSLRGAVSIARRLQDPLAELVKIEPKAIGVGQYQHDVNQTALGRSLDAVVEDCVNSVGVDVNMASAPLLARVAGLNATIAQNIVLHRNENGAFKKRSEIKKVARLGPKAFEQAAGFLRIMNGANPLDASAVHPEAYAVVERIAETTKRPLKAMIGDGAFLKSLDPKQFADERFGTPTVIDILSELEKPGRDPRPEFKTAEFKEGVEKIADLRPGMALEGVVTNVAAFGAFVDIGVHQDGLVHISELADRFVKDPREVVKAGDVVRVRVKDVDVDRKRIALTMKSGAIDGTSSGPSSQAGRDTSRGAQRSTSRPPQTAPSGGESAFAAAFKRAQGQEKG
ncbi:transcriptional accessory protein [Candidatus Filomicrobium marinum]|uniref:Small ribosomal subunit protein bS1 n=1 Tax=Candidatus Filomicrobium marinum TaxID=1608628 RepID=A0A0D6JGY5_9HYPH|nr:Tex family protein [Candidatus Filomicrobium marinum]CFX53384.1 transcriptional accessory protein [Candidatus Filomicrobium marinum]CPR19936.1 transcriptional accessory protein [Candidatus Filomicrobium marinum]